MIVPGEFSNDPTLLPDQSDGSSDTGFKSASKSSSEPCSGDTSRGSSSPVSAEKTEDDQPSTDKTAQDSQPQPETSQDGSSSKSPTSSNPDSNSDPTSKPQSDPTKLWSDDDEEDEEEDEEEVEEDSDEESNSSEDEDTEPNLQRFGGRFTQLQNNLAGAMASNKFKEVGGGTVSVSYKLRHKMDFDEMLSACSKCKYAPGRQNRQRSPGSETVTCMYM